MKRVLSFSMMLLIGLVLSQLLPMVMSADKCAVSYEQVQVVVNVLLGTCLAYIMINVGREFEVDRSNVGIYVKDYVVAMLAAAAPWIIIALYYIFVLMPSDWWGDGNVWKETLLLSRFAAPTSAGILFAMLAAIGLQSSWIYRKIQVLAIFDDLDTILLMIPLQVAIVGLKWQMGVILTIVVFLLIFGWKKMSKYDLCHNWKSVLLYAALIYGATFVIYVVTKHCLGEDDGLHIEVLLPAFVFGMVMKGEHTMTRMDERVGVIISMTFMLLVGMSMPQIVMDGDSVDAVVEIGKKTIASIDMPSWHIIALHVVVVSLLSNVGKLVPMLFYRNHSLRERLALSVGMFTRGEVGAGVIFVALGYNIGGPILLISVLTLVLNLILTGGFVLIVKRLSLKAYGKQ